MNSILSYAKKEATPSKKLQQKKQRVAKKACDLVSQCIEKHAQVVGFELGADDYVTKPFSVRELILRVKAILKRGPSNQSHSGEVEYSFGDLKLNSESHQVFINNEEISLTALEFRLIKHLIDRKGRVQTRDQLLEDVWGYSSNVTTRTVDTHIKRLREKLGSVGDHIQTIRGVGYRFSRSPE